MMGQRLKSRAWTLIIPALLLSIGIAISAFVYYATTHVEEALAKEVLEQQHDVSSLIYEYSNVIASIERYRSERSDANKESVATALLLAQQQMERMRSNYTFARLDGAAKAHAYIKPIIEDIDQWHKEGVLNYPSDDPLTLALASSRLQERYPVIREIASETDLVATDLIVEQRDFLENFRKSLIALLAGFALLSLFIVSLLIRQRNLQTQLAIDQELSAQRLIEAETRGRHQAEAALLGSEQFLRATLDSLPTNIAILDQDGSIAAVNTPWRNFVSSNADYPMGGIGHHYEKVFQSAAQTELEKQGIIAASSQVRNVLENKMESMFHEYPSDTDDNRRWYEVSMTTFNTAENRHGVLVHEDISQRKRMEERDRKLRAELAHVSRLTTAGELASGLAHELNQPLTAITHNCDAVISSVSSNNDIDSELIDTVSDISEQAQRAGSIIRSMRHLVKKDTTDMVPTDINKLVKETVRLTGPETREKNIAVLLHLADDLPAPIIDPIQIQQVLVNLERNGVEAMWQADSQTKRLSISTRLNESGDIQISISDTGPGVDPSFDRQLFTAFQTTKTDGMGLGLSISRNIVEAHGGRLWIDPSTEGDTIFHFTIPVAKG